MEPKAIYRLECNSLERPTTGVGYYSEFLKKATAMADWFSDTVRIKRFFVEDKEWITIWEVEP